MFSMFFLNTLNIYKFNTERAKTKYVSMFIHDYF